MKERKRKPALLPVPEPPLDPRLRDLLPQLEGLPEELRDALVTALEAVVKTHRLLADYPSRTQDGRRDQPRWSRDSRRPSHLEES